MVERSSWKSRVSACCEQYLGICIFLLLYVKALCTSAGNNSPQIAPPTGAPAVTVPMGYVRDVSQSALPAGLQFLARPWDEGRLLRMAYAFEQATQYRM